MATMMLIAIPVAAFSSLPVIEIYVWGCLLSPLASNVVNSLRAPVKR